MDHPARRVFALNIDTSDRKYRRVESADVSGRVNDQHRRVFERGGRGLEATWRAVGTPAESSGAPLMRVQRLELGIQCMQGLSAITLT